MERQLLAPTLLDGLTADLGSPKAKIFFDACNATIPFDDLAAPLAGVFVDSAKGGRPHFPVVMFVKILLAQKWFNLSDPAAEEMLADRLSLRRFVGLSLAEDTPDETTIGNFRRALLEKNLLAGLFDAVQACLEQRGLLVKEGTLVDATILEAPLGDKREDGSSTADPCATKTVKGGRSYFGYKGHIATDRVGFITDYVFDTAAPHDSKHIDQLTEKETSGVFADSAYMDQQRKADLEQRNVTYGIVYRRVKGQKELTEDQKRHNRFVAGVRAFVEHPFAWMAKMGFTRVRYRGLRRNALDFGLMAIAYNLKRAMSLLAALGRTA